MAVIAGFVSWRDDAPPVDLVLRLMEPTAAVGVKASTASLGGGTFACQVTRPDDTSACMKTGPILVATSARLDNASELAAMLAISPHRAGISTARLVAEAYVRWGPSFATRMLGDFAVAVLDMRTKRLVLARDPIGTKPLYYHIDDHGGIAFGTEIRNVLMYPHIVGAVNEGMIARFLDLTHFAERTCTFYSDVFRVAAGHALVLDVATGRREALPTWHPQLHDEVRGPDRVVERTFRNLLERAVQCRLPRPPARAGVMLSGGIDSAAVACTAALCMARSGGDALPAVSVVFDALPRPERRALNERAYASSVLRHVRSASVLVEGGMTSPLAALETQMRLVAQPFDIYSVWLSWEAQQAAQAAGLTVLLDGIDGDTTVSHGTEWLVELVQRGEFDLFEAEIARLAARLQIPPSRYVHNMLLPQLPGMLRAGRPMRAMLGLRRAAHYLRTHPAAAVWPYLLRPLWAGTNVWPESIVNYVRPVLRQRIEHNQRAGGSRQIAAPARMHLEAVRNGAWQNHAEVRDVFSRHWGVEIRSPFLDRRLIEFCCRLPMRHKVRDGWTRHVLRAATRELVPASVRWRSDKMNLSPYLYHSLSTRDATRLERMLSGTADVIAPYFDVDALRSGWERFRRRPLQSFADADALYKAAVLHAWLCQPTFAGQPVEAEPICPA